MLILFLILKHKLYQAIEKLPYYHKYNYLLYLFVKSVYVIATARKIINVYNSPKKKKNLHT